MIATSHPRPVSARNRVSHHAVSSIHTFLEAFAGITEWHRSDAVKTKAGDILAELVRTLSSSVALRGALGHYATLPVAV